MIANILLGVRHLRDCQIVAFCSAKGFPSRNKSRRKRVSVFLPLALLTLVLLTAINVPVQADIYRWDNGQVIPGTEGITLGSGVRLDHRDLRYADLSSIDLTDSRFQESNLTNAKFFQSTLTHADFSGAIVTDTVFADTTGFTAAQLATTSSYQAKNLRGIALAYNDLRGWDFSGQDLTSADLSFSTLAEANLSGANLSKVSLSSSTLIRADFSGAQVAGANFTNTTFRGFTQEQLESTASFQTKNLQGIALGDNNLRGWNLSAQDLTNSNLTNSTLIGTNLNGASVAGANFSYTTIRGFSESQLMSTASYQAKDLRGIQLELNNLNGWDLSGQDLTNSSLLNATLTQTHLSGANLKNANLNAEPCLRGTCEFFGTLQSAIFDSNTIYNERTVFPSDFDPIAHGLGFMSSPPGDFDASDSLGVGDIRSLQSEIRGVYYAPYRWLPFQMFDLDIDGEVTHEDVTAWIKELKHTYFGDANLDGEFNSTDLVNVFQAGQYEDAVASNSTWSTGDWNTDGEFTSSDLVVAFQDGGYEAGPRAVVAAVPEPSGLKSLMVGLCMLLGRWRTAGVYSQRRFAQEARLSDLT